MRFSGKKKTEILEGDLTPMIDMTFQLIAFFMIIMNFSKVDRAEEIELPSSALAKPPEVIPDYQIVLNLEPDGTVITGGNRYEIEGLSNTLTRSVSAAALDDVSAPNVAVIIRAHQDTPTAEVQKLIRACQDEDLENFVLRVLEKI